MAQPLFETGGGGACCSGNIGTFKGDLESPHFYPKDVRECVPRRVADVGLAQSPQSCREASAADLAHPRVACSGGHVTIIYNPPAAMARFRAFDSLDAGTHDWCAYYRNHSPQAMINALQAGDMAALAHAVRQANYFLGDEGDYRKGMQRYFNEL